MTIEGNVIQSLKTSFHIPGRMRKKIFQLLDRNCMSTRHWLLGHNFFVFRVVIFITIFLKIFYDFVSKIKYVIIIKKKILIYIPKNYSTLVFYETTKNQIINFFQL